MKGISPLIAAVLLIAFAVAAATLVMGWFGNVSDWVTKTTSNKTSDSIYCSNAAIAIEEVYVTPGQNGSAVALVKNTGFTSLRLTGAIVYNMFGSGVSSASTPLTLDVGDIGTVNFTWTTALNQTNDSSQYGQNGTINGSAWAQGKYGRGLLFDGSDDYVVIPHNANQLLTNGFTFAAWVKPNDYGENTLGRILDKSVSINTNAQDGYAWFVQGGIQKRMSLLVNNSPNIYSNQSTVNLNEWTHVAWSINSTSFGIPYINGVIKFWCNPTTGSCFNTTNPLSGINNNNTLCIGQRATSGGCMDDRTFNGTIDEVMIWNRTLNDTEINLTLANIYPPNTNDLIVHMRFDDVLAGLMSCAEFSQLIVTTNCGGISEVYTGNPRCG